MIHGLDLLDRTKIRLREEWLLRFESIYRSIGKELFKVPHTGADESCADKRGESSVG
jgi:hypothetical protein